MTLLKTRFDSLCIQCFDNKVVHGTGLYRMNNCIKKKKQKKKAKVNSAEYEHLGVRYR